MGHLVIENIFIQLLLIVFLSGFIDSFDNFYKWTKYRLFFWYTTFYFILNNL